MLHLQSSCFFCFAISLTKLLLCAHLHIHGACVDHIFNNMPFKRKHRSVHEARYSHIVLYIYSGGCSQPAHGKKLPKMDKCYTMLQRATRGGGYELVQSASRRSLGYSGSVHLLSLVVLSHPDRSVAPGRKAPSINN